jgi:hypothetical protein
MYQGTARVLLEIVGSLRQKPLHTPRPCAVRSCTTPSSYRFQGCYISFAVLVAGGAYPRAVPDIR